MHTYLSQWLIAFFVCLSLIPISKHRLRQSLLLLYFSSCKPYCIVSKPGYESLCYESLSYISRPRVARVPHYSNLYTLCLGQRMILRSVLVHVACLACERGDQSLIDPFDKSETLRAQGAPGCRQQSLSTMWLSRYRMELYG